MCLDPLLNGKVRVVLSCYKVIGQWLINNENTDFVFALHKKMLSTYGALSYP